MQLVKKTLDFLEKIAGFIVIAAMSIMTVVVIVAVIKRYFFGTTFFWTEELVRYLLIWTTFLGGAVAYRHFDLVLLDLFTGMMQGKFGAIVSTFIHLATIVFAAFIFKISAQYSVSPAILLKSSTSLGVSMFYAFVAIPIGFGLMIVFGLDNCVLFFNKISQVFKGIKDVD